MLKNPLLESLREQISSEDKLLMDESFAIADRIHFLLEKHNMTQRQLAEKLGKKESEISKWVSGGHNFTFQTLAKIGMAIGERVYVIPAKNESKIEHKESIRSTLRTSFVKMYKIHSHFCATPIKYENFVSPEISELEVNSVGVLCKTTTANDNSFVQAHLKPEAFKNIEQVKVS